MKNIFATLSLPCILSFGCFAISAELSIGKPELVVQQDLELNVQLNFCEIPILGYEHGFKFAGTGCYLKTSALSIPAGGRIIGGFKDYGNYTTTVEIKGFPKPYIRFLAKDASLSQASLDHLLASGMAKAVLRYQGPEMKLVPSN